MSLRSQLLKASQALGMSVGLSLACTAAQAGYFQWEAVELPAASGASCGNGSPYRFFVNRTPFTSKTVVMFEGGGACWDQGACKGGTLLDAVNPDGIPANYMTDFNRQAHWGLVTPFTARIDPLQAVQTQGWNIVYLTYCTGDVHTGNKVAVYDNVDPANPMALRMLVEERWPVQSPPQKLVFGLTMITAPWIWLLCERTIVCAAIFEA